MSDFCTECSIELFDKDYGNFKGLITEAEVKSGLGASVLCESCGFTLVDHTGKCISPDCDIHGINPTRKSIPD